MRIGNENEEHEQSTNINRTQRYNPTTKHWWQKTELDDELSKTAEDVEQPTLESLQAKQAQINRKNKRSVLGMGFLIGLLVFGIFSVANQAIQSHRLDEQQAAAESQKKASQNVNSIGQQGLQEQAKNSSSSSTSSSANSSSSGMTADQLKASQQTVKTLSKQNEQLRDQVKAKTKDRDNAKDTMNSAVSKNADLQKKVNDLEKQAKKSQSDTDDLSSKLSDTQSKLDTAKAKEKQLNDEITKLKQNNQSTNDTDMN